MHAQHVADCEHVPQGVSRRKRTMPRSRSCRNHLFLVPHRPLVSKQSRFRETYASRVTVNLRKFCTLFRRPVFGRAGSSMPFISGFLVLILSGYALVILQNETLVGCRSNSGRSHGQLDYFTRSARSTRHVFPIWPRTACTVRRDRGLRGLVRLCGKIHSAIFHFKKVDPAQWGRQ